MKYLRSELNIDSDVSSAENLFCCVTCYNSFNLFSRSDTIYQTSQYLKDSLEQFKSDNLIPKIDTLDIFAFQQILEYVVDCFLNEQVLLLPVVYTKYKEQLLISADLYNINLTELDVSNLVHSCQWLFRMLKSTLGKALVCYTPKNKKSGRLIYRNGTDILESMHSFLVFHFQETDKLKQEKQILTEKNKVLNSGNKKRVQVDQNDVLNKAVTIL